MTALSDCSFRPSLECHCERRVGGTSFTYDAPPAGETHFELSGGAYKRSYWRCGLCSHQFADHQLDLSTLYEGDYVEQTYGGKLRATFERILDLPPEHSDNSGRVSRVRDFAKRNLPSESFPSLLDVGSGLGVFPFRMKEEGYDCTALEPDSVAGKHLDKVVGVRTIVADFFDTDPNEIGKFDIVTLNKVIEHVEQPVSMLRRAAALLKPNGLLYVEVPDVIAAFEGPEREEFFIEHHHVFSPASLAMSGDRAGLEVLRLERLREPSGKFTIFMFARSRREIPA